MNVTCSSMNQNKKPSNKPIAPAPPRRSILSQGSFPGRSERSNFIASQATLGSASLSVYNELSFLQDTDDSHGDDQGNSHFIRSDNTLLSLVTRRLYDVEAKLACYKQHVTDLRQEIGVKDGKIQMLMQKLRNREKMVEGAAYSGANSSKITVEKAEYQSLQDRCANLKKTVEEMNQFFNDYGVTWVGESRCPRQVQEKFTVDFQRLLACIDELNLFVREGESQMVYTNQGAAFKMPESVPLTLFSNGLMLFSGPFRDYDDPVTQEFVKDILDGFFPSELQRSYPDGVPFKVIDKHEAMFQDPKSRVQVFGGTGQRLGHISSSTMMTHKDETVNTNKPTPRKAEAMKSMNLAQSKLNCLELMQDKRVGVNSARVDNSPDRSQTNALPDTNVQDIRSKYLPSSPSPTKQLPDTNVQEIRSKYLPSSPSPTKQLPDTNVQDPCSKYLPSSPSLTKQLPKKDSSLVKPVRNQRSKKLLEDLPVPVKKSTAHTNIADKAPADKDSSKMVKDTSTTITFGESVDTVGCGISNTPPPLKSIMKPNPTLATKYLHGTQDGRINTGSKTPCTDLEVFDKSNSIHKSIESFSSSSTITPETLENRDFKDLPHIVKEQFEKCCNQSADLMQPLSSCSPVISETLRNMNVTKKRCETNTVGKRIGAEEFLKKLPPVVVRDGKLIDIRGGVSHIIQAPKPAGPSYHTIKFDDNHPRIQLKIRSVDGEKIYLVYISPHRTIGDLRVGLDEMTRINGGQPTKYTILNASNPSKVNGLSNNQLTLQQLGIAHNTVLFLQNSTSPRDVPLPLQKSNIATQM